VATRGSRSSLSRAGGKLSAMDVSDPDWWHGRCLLTGAVGLFPSTYALRLLPGERPLQVLQAVQLPQAPSSAASAYVDAQQTVKLLRDQVSKRKWHDLSKCIDFRSKIVVQVSEEPLRDGSVLVRAADGRQVACPPAFLQEV